MNGSLSFFIHLLEATPTCKPAHLDMKDVKYGKSAMGNGGLYGLSIHKTNRWSRRLSPYLIVPTIRTPHDVCPFARL